MIDIRKYFLILFLTVRISNTKLKQFSESHILRLTANNPGGIYTPIIVLATNAYNLFYGNSGSQELQLAVQKSLTSGMNSSHVAYLKFIRQKEGTIGGFYGKGSPIYIEAFPGGLDAFDHANLMDFGIKGLNFLNFCIAHELDLGTALVTECTTLNDTFKANRTAQLTQIGNVDGIHTGSNVAKSALCSQLTYNLLTVARDNLGHPEVVGNYFDTSIIAPTADDAIRGKIQVNTTTKIESEGLLPTTTYLLKNNGEVDIFFSKNINGFSAGPIGVTVTSHTEAEVGEAELGPGPFLNGTNRSGTMEADYSVTIY